MFWVLIVYEMYWLILYFVSLLIVFLTMQEHCSLILSHLLIFAFVGCVLDFISGPQIQRMC